MTPNNFFPLVFGVAGAFAGPLTVFACVREHFQYIEPAKLRSFATTDPLTGVLNRCAFQNAVNDEQLRMMRTDKTAALVLFDLDHFKDLNDK
ncbi:MAG: GGDEF domain-containing protein [Henriciella sp.]